MGGCAWPQVGSIGVQLCLQVTCAGACQISTLILACQGLAGAPIGTACMADEEAGISELHVQYVECVYGMCAAFGTGWGCSNQLLQRSKVEQLCGRQVLTMAYAPSIGRSVPDQSIMLIM
jgi:hypothetical protein